MSQQDQTLRRHKKHFGRAAADVDGAAASDKGSTGNGKKTPANPGAGAGGHLPGDPNGGTSAAANTDTVTKTRPSGPGGDKTSTDAGAGGVNSQSKTAADDPATHTTQQAVSSSKTTEQAADRTSSQMTTTTSPSTTMIPSSTTADLPTTMTNSDLLTSSTTALPLSNTLLNGGFSLDSSASLSTTAAAATGTGALNGGSASVSGGALVGIIVGALAGAGLLFIIVSSILRRRRRRRDDVDFNRASFMRNSTFLPDDFDEPPQAHQGRVATMYGHHDDSLIPDAAPQMSQAGGGAMHHGYYGQQDAFSHGYDGYGAHQQQTTFADGYGSGVGGGHHGYGQEDVYDNVIVSPPPQAHRY